MSALQTHIMASVFGGVKDNEISAYTGKRLDSTSLYVALPARFHGDRPRVRVMNHFNREKSVTATIEDIGPWNTDDPYWEKGSRPQSESGHDMRGRRTNTAGIDVSPAVARALGINGMGLVAWEFVNDLTS